jgi:hypothetical protein
VYTSNGVDKACHEVARNAAGVQAASGMLLANFKHVIHAVGPEWTLEPNPTDGTLEKGKQELQTTIENVFRAANGIEAKSIVFCVISGGLFCHQGSKILNDWGKREKTAAREVLVESILTQVNLKGNLITEVVIFEYDDRRSIAHSLEAKTRLQETIALLQAAVTQPRLPPAGAGAGAGVGAREGAGTAGSEQKGKRPSSGTPNGEKTPKKIHSESKNLDFSSPGSKQAVPDLSGDSARRTRSGRTYLLPIEEEVIKQEEVFTDREGSLEEKALNLVTQLKDHIKGFFDAESDGEEDESNGEEDDEDEGLTSSSQRIIDAIESFEQQIADAKSRVQPSIVFLGHNGTGKSFLINLVLQVRKSS